MYDFRDEYFQAFSICFWYCWWSLIRAIDGFLSELFFFNLFFYFFMVLAWLCTNCCNFAFFCTVFVGRFMCFQSKVTLMVTTIVSFSALLCFCFLKDTPLPPPPKKKKKKNLEKHLISFLVFILCSCVRKRLALRVTNVPDLRFCFVSLIFLSVVSSLSDNLIGMQCDSRCLLFYEILCIPLHWVL